jgi:hypothetical protein
VGGWGAKALLRQRKRKPYVVGRQSMQHAHLIWHVPFGCSRVGIRLGRQDAWDLDVLEPVNCMEGVHGSGAWMHTPAVRVDISLSLLLYGCQQQKKHVDNDWALG